MAAALACLAVPLTRAVASQIAADPTDTQVMTSIPTGHVADAEFDDTLTIGGEEIEARKKSSRMSVEVMINDTGPYNFIVDSGADTSVIGEGVAASLALPAAAPAILNSMTESTVVERVEVDSLELGPTRFHGLRLPVLKERNLGGAGMLGLDALVEQRLMLDYENRVITIDDASSPAPRFDGQIVVTARLQRGQLILTELEADGQSVSAVIDTGSEITIGNLALRDQLIRRDPDLLQTVKITGVTGVETEVQFARVGQIRMGPVLMENVSIAFADLPPFTVFGLSDEPALLLGTDLMEQFRRISLDFRSRKVRFQLRNCRAQTVRIRTRVAFASRIVAKDKSACSG